MPLQISARRSRACENWPPQGLIWSRSGESCHSSTHCSAPNVTATRQPTILRSQILPRFVRGRRPRWNIEVTRYLFSLSANASKTGQVIEAVGAQRRQEPEAGLVSQRRKASGKRPRSTPSNFAKAVVTRPIIRKCFLVEVHGLVFARLGRSNRVRTSAAAGRRPISD